MAKATKKTIKKSAPQVIEIHVYVHQDQPVSKGLPHQQLPFLTPQGPWSGGIAGNVFPCNGITLLAKV